MFSVQLCKNFTGPPFCGRVDQKFQNFSRYFFWEQPSKYCIGEFEAIFVCLLLSWSIWYSVKRSSNFGGHYVDTLIHSKFKISAIFVLKKEPQKKPQIFHVFKGPLFHNGWPYWYECWRVLRNSCELSKKCGFATFPKI